MPLKNDDESSSATCPSAGHNWTVHPSHCMSTAPALPNPGSRNHCSGTIDRGTCPGTDIEACVSFLAERCKSMSTCRSFAIEASFDNCSCVKKCDRYMLFDARATNVVANDQWVSWTLPGGSGPSPSPPPVPAPAPRSSKLPRGMKASTDCVVRKLAHSFGLQMLAKAQQLYPLSDASAFVDDTASILGDALELEARCNDTNAHNSVNPDPVTHSSVVNALFPASRFFVDYVHGSDSATGTQTNPLKTVMAAVVKARRADRDRCPLVVGRSHVRRVIALRQRRKWRDLSAALT